MNEFAIKRLHSKKKKPFNNERKMLLAFAGSPHLSLVNLCATYTWKGSYHFVFPWADMSLNEYWKEVSRPKSITKPVLWMLRQCRDIAFGLHCMHDPSTPLRHKPADINRGDQNSKSSDDSCKKDSMFALHGDIKPDNILWYRSEDPYGRLILADFGRSAFQDKESKSKITIPYNSTTYAAPECEFKKRISSLQYDIWGLGCVYLQFITWILKGCDGIQKFAECREEEHFKHPKNITVDQFFSLRRKEEREIAMLNPKVTRWISKLRTNPSSCQILDEFLELITDGMLRIHHSNRFCSGKVHEKLAELYDRASKNPEVLEPKTRKERLRDRIGSVKGRISVQATSFVDLGGEIGEALPPRTTLSQIHALHAFVTILLILIFVWGTGMGSSWLHVLF
jgi:serine/threonine protein kinase